MSHAKQEDVLRIRKLCGRPWHSPPHFHPDGKDQFLITAACFEHAPIIGNTSKRIAEFSEELLLLLFPECLDIHAWCVLPNHYHVLIHTDRIHHILRLLGEHHGRTSRLWNLEEDTTGRQVWCRASDRRIRTDRHFWTTMNYIHHNPVRHGYVDKWQQWPWGSAPEFLERVGREEALRIWQDYPLKDYGKRWDPE